MTGDAPQGRHGGADASPRVTVLMTVYNDERHVAQAIDSVLAQTHRDFELLIVDDGSTDGTAAILARYAAADPRIRVLTQPNSGTTAAANAGLEQARGLYVARLDSDDLSHPDRLAIEVAFLDAHPEVALVGGGSEIIDDSGEVIGVRNVRTADPSRTLPHRCIYQHSDVMFRRDVALRVGAYRPKFRNAQDYDLWLRISEVAGIAKLDVVLGLWRLNPGGYTTSRNAEQRSEFAVIRRFARQRRAGGTDDYAAYTPPAAPAHRRPIARADYDLLVAALLIQALRPGDARRRIRAALRAAPSLRALALLALSHLPRPLIAALVAVRSFYLNRVR